MDYFLEQRMTYRNREVLAGEHSGTLRPPFKKMLFPVQRPGVYITAEWELLFLILLLFFALSKISSFSYKKKKKTEKKKILRLPDWP